MGKFKFWRRTYSHSSEDTYPRILVVNDEIMNSKMVKSLKGKSMAFEFGPISKVKITLSGDAEKFYGSFNSLPDNVQEALQLICHAVCQVKDVLEQAEMKPFYIEDIWLLKIGNKYAFNDSEMMAIINVERIGNDYDVDFFSAKRFPSIQPLIDLAYDHYERNGRVLW